MGKANGVIFLSGPYTSPDPVANTHRACMVALELEAKGWLVLVPHSSLLRHLVKPMPYDYWLDLDLRLVALASTWTRFDRGAWSPGSNRERARAVELGLEIYESHDLVPTISGGLGE